MTGKYLVTYREKVPSELEPEVEDVIKHQTTFSDIPEIAKFISLLADSGKDVFDLSIYTLGDF